MKMNSDYANKTIKNLSSEIETVLQAEKEGKTYSYGISEKPIIPEYSFSETQQKLAELNGKIAKIRHAINVFNITTKIRDFDITVDEALGRMSNLFCEKKRLYALLQIPEQSRVRAYGSKEPDITQRNFNIDDVQAEYDRVSDELLRIQQAINVANLTIEFDVDI